MFLDKKQGRYHIIVIAVPQGKKEIFEKGKVGKMQGFKLRKVARLRNVNASETRKTWSFGYGEECIFFRLR